MHHWYGRDDGVHYRYGHILTGCETSPILPRSSFPTTHASPPTLPPSLPHTFSCCCFRSTTSARRSRSARACARAPPPAPPPLAPLAPLLLPPLPPAAATRQAPLPPGKPRHTMSFLPSLAMMPTASNTLSAS